MEQYIPKSALVAEINRLIELLEPYLGACAGQIVAEANAKLSVLEKLNDFLDTIEVKEVDIEKDLTDISWIKEVSGVKELSRAKEEALKAYPPQSIAANYDTINRRDAFEYGYLKAEKDLELTWEDMMVIHKCCKDAMNNHLYEWNTPEGQQKIYEDVLKRFLSHK